jgi:hypothetical protein
MKRSVLLVALGLASLLIDTRMSPSPMPAGPVAATTTPESKTMTAAESLDEMDARRPVPLLPMMANHQKQNMRDHLLAVQDIVAALATEDYPAMEKAAGRIGFSEQMGQMCAHMGAGAPGFTEQALAFHHTADRITAAAKARDRGRVLAELAATLQTCTACHAVWKEQVVDDRAWSRLTSTAAPMGHEMPH